jgi:hypothetical protein
LDEQKQLNSKCFWICRYVKDSGNQSYCQMDQNDEKRKAMQYFCTGDQTEDDDLHGDVQHEE